MSVAKNLDMKGTPVNKSPKRATTTQTVMHACFGKKTPLAQRTLLYFTSRMIMWNFSLILSLSSKYKEKLHAFLIDSLRLLFCLYKEKWKGREHKNLTASWLGKTLHQTKLLFYSFIWKTTTEKPTTLIHSIHLSISIPRMKIETLRMLLLCTKCSLASTMATSPQNPSKANHSSQRFIIFCIREAFKCTRLPGS